MACNENRNPLKHGGTNQEQRLLAGIRKGYISIDERDNADWIAFAEKFSAYLNFYDTTGAIAGSWQPFFESDVSAVLGSVAIQNIEEYKLEVSSRFDVLKSNEYPLAHKKEVLGALFAGIFSLSKGLDTFSTKLPAGSSVQQSIRNLISAKLQPALYKLIGYFKAGKKLNLIKELGQPEWRVMGQPVGKASVVLSGGLSSAWFTSTNNWSDYYSSVPQEQSIYGDASSDSMRKISHAANHNLFKGLFDQFLYVYAKVINDSDTALKESFTTADHAPHYALFLSFLQIFRHSKEHLNSLSQRHLDFYYREVLRIRPQTSIPDKVHVLIELAKQTDAHLLPTGTLFRAGKDASGRELFYALDADAVFSKARVAKLMSVYRGNVSDNFNAVVNQGRLFASSIINSADGMGKEIETDPKSWHPYINKSFTDGVLTGINMPAAQIGFAIASSNFYLTEGERIVNIRFYPAFSAGQLAALAAIECMLTTGNGWLQVAAPSWNSGTMAGPLTASELSFNIPGDADPITNYDPDVHGGLFNCSTPLLKVYLKNEVSTAYKYDLLKGITVEKIEVEVKVGLNANESLNDGGLKNLQLSNDFGVLEPSKPFLPFGPLPAKGSSLVIGNSEVFKKKNVNLFFKVGWKDLPADSRSVDYDAEESDDGSDLSPRVRLFSLEKGAWRDTDVLLNILSDYQAASPSPAASVIFPSSMFSLPGAVLVDYAREYQNYSITSSSGFLKLTLENGFGHAEYQKDLTRYLIEQAKPSPSATITEPASPYTPSIQSISLHYKASVTLDLNSETPNKDIQIFHLFPFGEAEQQPGGTVTLLPGFVVGAENVAEFYIGLEKVQAGEGVSLLFQVLEGTSNPLLEKPETHITWSYLSDNKWKIFDNRLVTDGTKQWIQSGIISIILPADATVSNTLLPPGYIWLRASVTEHAEAVCKFLSVDAQAALLSLQSNNNSSISSFALPAGSISKLKETSSAIKKVSQPYPSFGGRAAEQNEQYYLRVSERLRHKSRAITIWDYEHLVLQAFPAIHKVKCLNHTKFSGADYNEVAPGYVTIITIPNLSNRNDSNPLRPYTNQNVLEEIEDFLKRRVSCHVKLNVRHPQFEEVRLEFKLKLISGLEFNFYRELLQREITQFLTPWAYGNTADIEFGGRVHKSSMINFIEERSYVDYVTDVKMYHRKDETLAAESGDSDTIEASSAKSILVSAAASKHTIYEISEVETNTEKVACEDEYNKTKEMS